MIEKVQVTLLTVVIMVVLVGCGSNSGTGQYSESEEGFPELSSEEKEYLDEREQIIDTAISIANEQLDLFEECTECYRQEKEDNWFLIYELRRDAQDIDPPSGYEESHEAFVYRMSRIEEQATLAATDPVVKEVTQDQLYELTEEANDYADESAQALPSEAQDYYESS